MGCTKPSSKKVFRKMFYIKGFETTEQSINFSNRLQRFIIDNTESQIDSKHLWIVRPLQTISPMPLDLMTAAKREAIEKATISISSVDNSFQSILGRIFYDFEIS